MIPRDPTKPSTPTRPDSVRAAVPSGTTGWSGPVWGWLLVALPILFFFGLWSYYAVNVPKWDDHALRAFLYYLSQETTLTGKIYQIFRQHNEHRIVYDRIVTYLDYQLFGKLNYRHLMMIGNLSLLGLAGVFAAVLRRSGRAVWLLAPVVFFLFNLSQWENMYWGMAALQNFTVVFWVLWAIYLLTYTDRWLVALPLAIIATITSGNGLLVWPVAIVLLLVQRKFRPVAIWAMGAFVVIGLYFLGYEKPAGNPPDRGSVTDLLKGWFAFNGAAAEVFPLGSGFFSSLVAGGLLTIVALVVVAIIVRRALPLLTKSSASQTTPATSSPLRSIDLFFLGAAGFLIGTGAIVAWSRVGFGMEMLITSRYKMYSLTLLALVYTYGVITLGGRFRQPLGLIGLVAGLGLAWLSYVAFLDETIWWRHWLLTTQQFNATYSTNKPVPQLDPVTKQYQDTAPAFYDDHLSRLYSEPDQQKLSVTVKEEVRGVPVYMVTEPTLPVSDLRDGRAYVMFRSPQRVYLFPVTQNLNSGLMARLLPSRVFTNGFTATLYQGDLAVGTYQILILTIDAQGQWALHPTDQTVQLKTKAADGFKKNW
ncbi:hypothetical protein BN8_03857 [Fibrisoma limi BUZ 3]|uniref:Uncharacterized protein n=1 Tax=Fibrisoma limi BUZ 3 TaxID=1185876 RepID=I2GL86_9BACT|nr:hypothetical protein [Fibrisoma limi]CCH54662.1 hypothetical protein BN8_03857 [Fibrisoma limi BUZ 3]